MDYEFNSTKQLSHINMEYNSAGRTQDFQKGGGDKVEIGIPPLGAPSHPSQDTKTPRISATSFLDSN